MSFGVKTLVAAGTPFALQGGGHMPIAGAANIDSSGILLSSYNLDQLVMADDLSYVSVGPGNHWVDVYDYLEPYNKIIVGGRMGVVGVPGFLIGGGISFFSYEYGWSSANIASFEVSEKERPDWTVGPYPHTSKLTQHTSASWPTAASSTPRKRTSTRTSSGPFAEAAAPSRS